MQELILQLEAASTRAKLPDFRATKSLTTAYLYLKRLNQKRFCAVLQPDSVDIIPLEGDTMMNEFGMSAVELLEIGVYDDRSHFYIAAYDVLHGPVCQADALQLIKRVDVSSHDQFCSFVEVAELSFEQSMEVTQ